ncbi:hypothetical protein ACVWYQ_003203 [Bradyrhizobium sp. USDA 3397]
MARQACDRALVSEQIIGIGPTAAACGPSIGDGMIVLSDASGRLCCRRLVTMISFLGPSPRTARQIEAFSRCAGVDLEVSAGNDRILLQDVEGAEPYLFRGAEHILDRNNALLLEC